MTAINQLSLVVYYEINEGRRDEVKQRYKNSIVYTTLDYRIIEVWSDKKYPIG